MPPKTLEQAQHLLGTITQLQRRVLLGGPRKNLEGPSPVKELTMSQISTLMAIRNRGEMSLKEIAMATHVSPPSASSMVDRLVDLGMVERRHSDVDRRALRITITKMGQGAMDELTGELLKSLVQLLEDIGPDYARQWCEVYDRIQHCLDEEENGSSVLQRAAAEGAK